MIYIAFSVSNPFSRFFSSVKDFVIPVSTHKTIDLSIYRITTIVGFSFSVSGSKQDHAGFSFSFELLGYGIDFHFYDNRHYSE